jgi:hypothetical protein
MDVYEEVFNGRSLRQTNLELVISASAGQAFALETPGEAAVYAVVGNS